MVKILFICHGNSSGKNISNADEYIEFVKYVNGKAKPTHTAYATIMGFAEGEEPEYPVGTRCAVICYEGEENWDALIFVDTDDEGNIGRILLSRDSRYRFTLDETPADGKDLLEKAKGMPWQEALVARAHFHDLLDRGVELEEVQKTASKDEYELKSVLSDLFNNEISEETFAEAYMRGVKRSGASDYDEERLTRYGKQFLKDFMLRLSDEDQEKDIEEALILLGAMGSLYCGDSK